MEPRFELATKHDKESYRNMVTVDYILHQKAPIALFYAIAAALAAFIWWGGLQSGHQPTPLVMVISAVLTFGICLMCVPYLDRFAVKRVSARILKSTLKTAKDLNMPVGVAFGEESFTVTTPNNQEERPYSAVTHLAETRGYFLLLEGKEYCYTLEKSGFTRGTAQDFKAFVAQKCGKAFRELDY